MQRFISPIAAIIAVLFGILTLFAGSRVLLGADPGYKVFRPLLLYNTTMGAAYLAAGIAIWRNLRWSKFATGFIFSLNLLVLVSIVLLYSTHAAVAVDSLRAMTFRTTVWLVLFVVVARFSPPSAPPTHLA